MKRLLRPAGLVGHLALGAAAITAAVVTTSGVTYIPLRRAMIVLVVVLVGVSLLGRIPHVFGPVAESADARATRFVGFVLAGFGAWGAIVEFWFDGDPAQVNPAVAQRASSGVPLLTALLAIYLVAFLVATRQGSALRTRTLVQTTAIAFTAVVLWATAVVLIPPAHADLAVMLVVVAAIAATLMAQRLGDSPGGAGLLGAVLAAQTLVWTADVMFHLGPNAWLPYAGPGPLTPQGQLAQNRVEAIDPYTVLLVLGGLAAVALVVNVLMAKTLARLDARDARPVHA